MFRTLWLQIKDGFINIINVGQLLALFYVIKIFIYIK